MLRKTILAGTCALALAACNMTAQQQAELTGGAIGAGAGLLTAKILGSNSNWTALAVIAGAAAGVLVAKNNQTGECAYSNGDGTYYTAACP